MTASNLIRKETPNLRAKGTAITFIYDFNRLSQIKYPISDTVTYTYGVPNAGGNAAGRISHIESGVVKEDLEYGRLGEPIKSTKSIHVSKPVDAWVSYVTQYEFDTMGRMQYMVLPDGEKITYVYNQGGLLKGVYGNTGGVVSTYVKSILYNEFEQRVEMDYGNDAVSKYTYDESTRRLDNLLTTLDGKTLQNITYRFYDSGNIQSRENKDFIAPDGSAKTSYQDYKYDEVNKIHRLVSSTGSYKIGSREVNKYNNTFTYDDIGNMLTKVQTNSADYGGGMTPVTDTTYSYNYQYNPLRPHAVISTGAKTYQYDGNGNMTGWVKTVDPGLYMNFSWDEENRLTRTVERTIDNLITTEYKYEDTGKRIIKRGSVDEVVYVNDNYALRNGEVKSKHIFADNTRVATKISSDGTEGIFYYHADHLGSSSVITDGSRSISEHLEYFPYGETWVQEASSTTKSMPYKFSAKEQDPETGLYYFGARYYEPKLSRWISADPVLAKYIPNAGGGGGNELPGHGGVYNSVNLSLYHYAGNSPVNIIDPNGNDIILLYAPTGAPIPWGGYAGHTAGLIEIQNGEHKGEWMYYSKNGITPDGKMPTNEYTASKVSDGDVRHNDHIQYFKSPQDFFKNMMKQVGNFRNGNKSKQCVEYVDKSGNPRYTDSVRIITSPLQDVNIGFKLQNQMNKPYVFLWGNCNDAWDDAMDEYLPTSDKLMPNIWFKEMKDMYTKPDRLRDRDMADDMDENNKRNQ